MWGIWGLLCNFRFFPSLWALTEQCRQKTVYKFITEFSQVEYSASLFLVFKASSPCHTAQNSVNVHSIPSARTWCLEFTLTGLSLGKDLWRFCSLDDALIFQESAEALVNVAMRLKTWCVHLFNLIFWRLSLLFSLPLRKLSFYITVWRKGVVCRRGAHPLCTRIFIVSFLKGGTQSPNNIPLWGTPLEHMEFLGSWATHFFHPNGQHRIGARALQTQSS